MIINIFLNDFITYDTMCGDHLKFLNLQPSSPGNSSSLDCRILRFVYLFGGNSSSYLNIEAEYIANLNVQDEEA